MKWKALLILFLLGHLPLFAQKLVYIPDPNFRAFINANYPGFMIGDSLIVDSAATVKETFDCSGQGIRDLTGIEYFINITDLRCSYNQLTFLPDLSSITGLKFLFCEGNQLTELPDLSSLISLTGIWCGNNQLEQLPDLSNLRLLQILNCSNNRLTSLPDLSNNVNLTQLYCSGNELTELPDLSNLKQLSVLWVYQNQLERLPDLSQNINLTDLRCYQNQLTELPGLSALKDLIYLDCADNQLEDLGDLSGMIQLRLLDVRNNQLWRLPDLSASLQLEFVYCQGNKLDFSDARELKIIDNLPNLLDFEYAPQKPFGKRDTLVVVEFYPLQFGIAAQDSATRYEWYKNGTIVLEWTTPQIQLAAVQLADSGVYRVRVYGTALANMNHGNGISDFVSEPIRLEVLPGNRPPQFLTKKLDTAYVAREYQFQLLASDPNGDSLTFSAIQLPGWLHLQPDGLLFGTPTMADTGVQIVSVLVADNGFPIFRDTLTADIRVLLDNRKPRFLPIEADTALVAREYRKQIMASDPDGDSLRFGALHLPDWLQLSPDGWLTGTPALSDTGVAWVEVAVRDNGVPPLGDTLAFPLRVKVGNSAPYFVTTRLDTAFEDIPYRFSIQVRDAEDDSVTFRAVGLPPWLSLSPSGVLQGTPGLADTGIYAIKIVIQDNGVPPLSDSLTFELVVAINPHPPQLSLLLFQNPALTRHANLIIAADVRLKSAPEVVFITEKDTVNIAVVPLENTDRLYQGKLTFSESGIYRLIATATRSNGITGTAERVFSVLKALPGQEGVLLDPLERVRLTVPENAIVEETYFICLPEMESNEPVYQFLPQRSFDTPLILEVRYDKKQVKEEAKLFIYRQRGSDWEALPSVVFPNRQVVRSAVEHLGVFRLGENPDFAGSNLVPTRVQLLPNYPNPFNPTTTIAYHLVADGWVTLTIYNGLGQKVKTLVDQLQLAGIHRVAWDGRNDRGQRLPSGLYYYQLRTGKTVLTRRMLLIR